MKRITVIAKNKETYFIKRLMEEVGEQVKLFDPWSDIDFPEADLYIARTTGVYNSDLDLLIAKSLPAEKLINPYPVLKLFRDKKTQYSWFEEKDISCTPWISLAGQSEITIEKFFRLYPFSVVKPVIGQGGWGIELLTWENFRQWKKKKGADDSWILQAYVRDAVEYRIFFMKNEEVIVLKRTAQTGITANFRTQGKASVDTFPDEYKEELEKLIHLSGAKYGAIDCLVRDGRCYFLELNVVPGIEQVENLSGHNIIKKLLKNCLNPTA